MTIERQERTRFTEVAPVKRAARAGAGRKKGPRPYLDGVRAIVNKTSTSGGATAPMTFKVDVEVPRGEVALAAFKRRARRQLTEAGKQVAIEQGAPEPYLIGMDVRRGGFGSKSVLPVYELRFWHRNQQSN